jgi:carbon monoxide dehydrogenase subunit G
MANTSHSFGAPGKKGSIMKIRNEFTVPVPPAEAWMMLNDVPRIARCAPGAQLLEQGEDGVYVGTISVRLGPVLLNFKGKLIYREVDEANHRVVAEASGSETKARGTAQANVAFALASAPEGTRVLVDTDVQLAGSIAQYGRGAALIQNTAQVIMNEFARNFAAQLGPRDESEPQDAAKPISGLKVLFHGVRNTIKG